MNSSSYWVNAHRFTSTILCINVHPRYQLMGASGFRLKMIDAKYKKHILTPRKKWDVNELNQEKT